MLRKTSTGRFELSFAQQLQRNPLKKFSDPTARKSAAVHVVEDGRYASKSIGFTFEWMSQSKTSWRRHLVDAKHRLLYSKLQTCSCRFRFLPVVLFELLIQLIAKRCNGLALYRRCKIPPGRRFIIHPS